MDIESLKSLVAQLGLRKKKEVSEWQNGYSQ